MSVLGKVADAVLGPRVPERDCPVPLPPGVVLRRNRWFLRVGGFFMGRRPDGTRRAAGAVTLRKTILVDADAERIDPGLVVHELVHVEHWKDPLFLVRYVAAWARHGFDYHSIPYEVEAYERQRRFVDEARTQREGGAP